MSSDNAKLRLAPEQSIEEWMQENGYKSVGPAEGTDLANELLDEAYNDLDEALHRMEEGTGNHDTVGTACDELDYVMYQTGAWQGDEDKQWLDGSDPVEHAVNCLTYCEEAAVCGDQDAPSTELVRKAADSLNRAAILLWGDKFTTAFESRRNEADQRRAAATLEAMYEDADEGDEDTAIFDVNDMESMGEENMEDARAKANLCEVHDETEAARLAANVADGINHVAVTCAYASCIHGIGEDMRVTLETLAKQSKMMLVEAVSVCNHLNGHTTAKSDGDAR